MVNRFIFQWHLSENCNLRCRHCYQENHEVVELDYKSLELIYQQIKEFLLQKKILGHINITGGEPLCNPHFFKILDLIKKDNNLITFSILTNGTLITKSMAKRLAEYHPYYIQVSLEGGQKTNDYIRGKKTYQKIAQGLNYLKEYNIYTSISFTATKINYQEFPKVVKFAKKHHVNNVWSDRYIPLSNTSEDLNMNFDETRKYLNIMNQERNKLLKDKKTNLTISMYRALQFQMTNDFAYGCTAGDTLLTIMENGNLVPCRRMPIVVGNLFIDSIINLYDNNKILKELRQNKVPDDCQACEHSNTCRGGLKCLTYAIYKDLNHKDVGCDLTNS